MQPKPAKNHLIWNEVLLLANSFKLDIIIIIETGIIDIPWINKLFPDRSIYYQKGENSFGSVAVLIRNELKSKRVDCKLPNVCPVEIELEEKLRIIGIYAPESKSWTWQDLTPLISSKCVLLGDFNVDLDKDVKSHKLIKWTDSCTLLPCLPECSTSLKSKAHRIIDYALSRSVPTSVQTYEGGTTSDHKPILSVITCDRKESAFGKKVRWKVVTLFLAYVFPFWQSQWNLSCMDEVYKDYVLFLSLLISRCTISFPINKYRIALPATIRALLSYSRAISFRARRTGECELRRLSNYMRAQVKKELKLFLSDQLRKSLASRYSTSHTSVTFWSKIKRCFKPARASLHGFILPSGDIVRDSVKMVDIAAEHYKQLYAAPKVARPHPYVDAPSTEWENEDELIPPVTYEEVIKVVTSREKKLSCDAHGLSTFLFKFLPPQFWTLFVQLFNYSFTSFFLPSSWKDVRIILLAKKESICNAANTRPIALLDIFLKVIERLFLTRLLKVLKGRGILPDTQSGFRSNFRLQTRILLLVEQIASLMSNSSPVATVFVDYKQAFDQLWIEGCLGKFKRMGIPKTYREWIKAWLINRRGYVEIQGARSQWFHIERGGPQGSSLTPTVFITYHADMDQFLQNCTTFYFADDLAAVLAGRIGAKYTDQCLDLERRLEVFFDNLEYYSLLSIQPINYEKTEALWSARAWGIHEGSKLSLRCGSQTIKWCKSYKYLGYWISSKLGWGTMINNSLLKIGQRVGMIKSCRIFGTSSVELRRILFSCYILPEFTWLFAIFPLLTEEQRTHLEHFYDISLKQVLNCQRWPDEFFEFLFKELPLVNRCTRYWNKYLQALANSKDGELLLEPTILSTYRREWLGGYQRINSMRTSKRFMDHVTVLEKVLAWHDDNPLLDTIIQYEDDDIELLQEFPETFSRL